jgi:hypothetical protein
MEISIQMHESLFWDIDSNLHKCIFLGPMFYIKATMENNSILKNMEWKYLVWYNKKMSSFGMKIQYCTNESARVYWA